MQVPASSGTDVRKAVSIGAFVVITLLLTLSLLWGDYGLAVFVFTPVILGALPVLFYGYKRKISEKEALRLSSLTLAAFMAVLLLFAIEGLICILVAAPIALVFALLGGLFAHAILQKVNGLLSALVLISVVPAVKWLEKGDQPLRTAVVTSVEIDAEPQTIWKYVVAFPELDRPTELIFQTGIAYPTSAQINGQGVGAVRPCNFTTGCFVEPITVWEEGRRLRFDVVSQPEPMKELSLWEIHPPHLDSALVFRRGQFKLIPLPDGKTRLEGTTWYELHLRPHFYWAFWSRYIIHKIHERVLRRIKQNAEREKQPRLP